MAHRSIRIRLNEAIESFLPLALSEGWDTPEGASNQCTVASDEFVHWLEKRGNGLVGEIEHYDPDIALDRKDYPYEDLAGCYLHWAVRVGGTVVDWTARQFTDNAPFPAVYRSKRREWRNP